MKLQKKRFVIVLLLITVYLIIVSKINFDENVVNFFLFYFTIVRLKFFEKGRFFAKSPRIS
jgi:hypothetical protein